MIREHNIIINHENRAIEHSGFNMLLNGYIKIIPKTIINLIRYKVYSIFNHNIRYSMESFE